MFTCFNIKTIRMSAHIKFKDAETVSDYQPTDSEEELSESEQKLLKNVRSKGRKYSDSEEELFNIYEQSDEDDENENESDLALSDVEDQNEEDGIPDAKAWGKNKRQYYSTDYVDPDYGGFQGVDATNAEREEEEARNLQQELAKHLNDDDFALDFARKDPVSDDEQKEGNKRANVIKTDVSQLPKRQKLQLLMKESPELFALIEDYKKRMVCLKNEVYPPIKLYKEGKIVKSDAMDFLNSYAQLILNYSLNITMYLLLKSKKISIKNHPVIKRLYQYRQLLSQMDPIYDQQIHPQLDALIEIASKVEPTIEKAKSKKKVLSILKPAKEGESDTQSLKRKRPEKHATFAENLIIEKHRNDTESEELEPKEIVEQSNLDDGNALNNEIASATNEDTKRAINYQIAKNKGLKPRRKKEQRNPRVKHRNKFKKAAIRRKGAVREVRREESRYSGEISGIKASVCKSIKLKS